MSINDRLKANRDRYERKLADIQQDNDLTSEAKARKLRPVFQEAKAVDDKLRGERMAGLREKVRDTEREAFAPPPLRGADPALLQLGYRNALDSVEPLTDAGELSRKLDRATSTGDRTLAKAVAIRANQIGADGVVRAYLDSDEDASRKWTAWAEAHTEAERVEKLGETLGFGDVPISEPDELRGYVQEVS